jgi:DNA-binding MarR family transcriptional regulator
MEANVEALTWRSCVDQTVLADAALITLLHNAEQAATAAFAEVKGNLQLTLAQTLVLLTLLEERDSQWTITQLTGVDRSTLSDIIRRLEKSGLVIRERSKDDARRILCRITPKGRDAAKEAAIVARSALERLLKPIPTIKRNAFLNDLQSFVLGQAKIIGMPAE